MLREAYGESVLPLGGAGDVIVPSLASSVDVPGDFSRTGGAIPDVSFDPWNNALRAATPLTAGGVASLSLTVIAGGGAEVW